MFPSLGLFDPEKGAISLSTQTALRDVIGTHTLEEMLTQREALGQALQEMLDAKTKPWGDHGAVGGDPRRDHPGQPAERREQAGAGGARAATAPPPAPAAAPSA